MKEKKLEGKRWGELTKKHQAELLLGANCIDGRTGGDSKGGECIVDLTPELSVPGYLNTTGNELEIKIDNNAVIYGSDFWEKVLLDPINEKGVLENLQSLKGEEFNEEDIICAFEDFEEYGEKEVIVSKSHNRGYDYSAYINTEKSTEFLFNLRDGIIKDVTMKSPQRTKSINKEPKKTKSR